MMFFIINIVQNIVVLFTLFYVLGIILDALRKGVVGIVQIEQDRLGSQWFTTFTYNNKFVIFLLRGRHNAFGIILLKMSFMYSLLG
jgi:hypothetical protein